MNGTPAITPGLHAFIDHHLGRTGVNYVPVVGGRNNQCWKLLVGTKAYFLKRYFPSPGHDRLASEWHFLHYAASCGVTSLPRPLACDLGERAILFEFIEGVRFVGRTIGEREVNAALDLLSSLNPLDRDERGWNLPSASDACFSLASHAAHVERRLGILAANLVSNSAGQEAREFVIDRLGPHVRDTIASLRGSIPEDDWTAMLPRAESAVSPSDFGFHNALLAPDGGIVFLDFEYAGWDDPLKVVCDFFTQPDCPAPFTLVELFCRQFKLVDRPPLSPKWVRRWIPAYAAKWACIMLNPLLSTHGERTTFVRHSDEPAAIVARAIATFEQRVRELR